MIASPLLFKAAITSGTTVKTKGSIVTVQKSVSPTVVPNLTSSVIVSQRGTTYVRYIVTPPAAMRLPRTSETKVPRIKPFQDLYLVTNQPSK